MAGKIKHFMNRNGRYYSRIVIPKNLRPYIDNLTELRTPLGADRRTAMRMHPIAVAELMQKIAQAGLRESEDKGRPVQIGRYPLTDRQIAMLSYQARLIQDEEARNQNAGYALVGIDDGYVDKLRQGISGTLSDTDLQELVGHRIVHFRLIGNTTVEFGNPDWRSLARAICISEYEALARMLERDDGDYTGLPDHPAMQNVEPVIEELPPISLNQLFTDYIKSRQLLGKGREAEKRWKPVFEKLRKHLGHDNARHVTKKDIIVWRDKLLQTLAPKTVSSVYLASVRTVFKWAVREDRLSENPAEDVRQEVPRKRTTRERGYTRGEGIEILCASRQYQPQPFMGGASREFDETTAAKQWVPLLCAHTGARVVEMTQLRKKDIRIENGTHVIRITPDAGTVKTGLYRDVPLHNQVVELGFVDFVDKSEAGPLFYRLSKGEDGLVKARVVAGRISDWLNKTKLVPHGVSPSHGWRHRFKTVTRELGLSERVVEAICGHASRTAGDDYGDVNIIAMKKVIDSMPSYPIK